MDYRLRKAVEQAVRRRRGRRIFAIMAGLGMLVLVLACVMTAYA